MKTLAIVSGGLDSTVLAYVLAGKMELGAMLTVMYGQKHVKEVQRAERTAKRLGVEHIVCDLRGLSHILVPAKESNYSLLNPDAPIPEGHYAEGNMKSTVVPNRNMMLLSVAIAAAMARGMARVAYGAHAGDHAVYPDCRPEFANAMQCAAEYAGYEPLELARPFIHITKADIVRIGAEHKVHFEETWTCYKGNPLSCGRCGTCVERLEAFALAECEDPLVYEDRDYWRDVTKLPQFMSAHNPNSLSLKA